MSCPGDDWRYDAPEEPEYTLAEELAMAADVLLSSEQGSKAFAAALEQVRIIRGQMKASELPDYDEPIDATEEPSFNDALDDIIASGDALDGVR